MPPCAGRRGAHFRARTTTDFAGSFTSSVSPFSTAPANAAGSTAFGASKVLCALIAGAVRMRPATDFAVSPASFTVSVAGWEGLVLASETCTAEPSAARVADALTSGIFSEPNT